ncbi:MAG: hypothetical protein JSS97_19980 [Actinobacteria bacterium]|nr:hypothetical protein [Actinomycetota bacterium]
MPEETITVSLTHTDAEVLLGVLSAERHNPDSQAVCDKVRRQLDAQLADGKS